MDRGELSLSREQYYVAAPTIILYSQDVPLPSENPESAPGVCST